MELFGNFLAFSFLRPNVFSVFTVDNFDLENILSDVFEVFCYICFVLVILDSLKISIFLQGNLYFSSFRYKRAFAVFVNFSV